MLWIFRYSREFSVEQSNIYFTVIGQAFHELWQFKTRHANTRNFRAVLMHFFQIQFLGLMVNKLVETLCMDLLFCVLFLEL